MCPAYRDPDGDAEQGGSDTQNTGDAKGKRKKKKKQGKCVLLFFVQLIEQGKYIVHCFI